jgi:poly(ADP-ribose) glycohydrolase
MCLPFVSSEVTVHVSKKLVASLLANCFLCTFPEETPGNTFPFTFGSFFMSDCFMSAPTARCKCFLVYFEKISDQKFNLEGFIKVQRKVFPQKTSQSLYSKETWKRQRAPLCSFRIEDSKKIEDCGTLTLQVDFANAYIGGGVLHSGCVQEEIRFTICPELLLSRLLMEMMEDNEAIIVSGYERCSNYKGYAMSFACTGECNDDSQRDDLGAPMSSLVAIDAMVVNQEHNQYSTSGVLRELNKALTGFVHHGNQGDLPREKTSHLVGKSVVTSYSSTPPHQTEKDSSKREQVDGLMEQGGKKSSCKEISISVPQNIPTMSSQLSTVEEVTTYNDLLEYSDSLAKKIVSEAKGDSPLQPSNTSVDTASYPDGVLPGESIRPESVGPSDEMLSGKRSGSVQFMLDLKHMTWSQISNTSTRSVIGSDPDPSAISTVSHYSSRSSSITGQPHTVEDYSEFLSTTIVSQAVRSAVSPESSDSHSSGMKEKESVSNFVDGLVSNIFVSAVEEATTPLATTTTSDAPTSDKQQFAPHGPPISLGSEDFANKLSLKLVQEVVRTPSDHTPLKGSSLRMSASHLLPLERIRRAPSTDAVWSTAPTMDQDSSPPSPGELDAMAMDYASDISEYANLLAFKCMADAIRSLTGQEINESFDEATGRFSARETPSDEQHSLPSMSRLVDIHRVLLRPVVTGNWGCGAFGGNPQLKALIQWMAVSVSGRPEMVYCTFRDRQLTQLKRVIEAIEKRGLNTGQLALLVFRCCDKYAPRMGPKVGEDFFALLLKELLH